MKKKSFYLLCFLMFTMFSCFSVQPMSESTKLFMQETELSVVIPIRFFTWIKVENSNKIQDDIFSGKLDFSYDSSGDYLLKIISENGKVMSIWGNQLLLQSDINRNFIFTSFIASTYTLENNNDPLDIAFEVLNQILADDMYASYEESLLGVYKFGIQQYRIGGSAWERFKTEYFTIENKTIRLRKIN